MIHQNLMNMDLLKFLQKTHFILLCSLNNFIY